MTFDRRTFLRAGSVAAVASTLAVPGLALAQPRTPDWARLRRHIDGDVVLPGDDGYAVASRSYFGNFDDVQPRGVVYCQNTADVQTALRFAQDADIRTVVRSGGHSTGGYSTSRGMILDVSRLNQVTLSSPDRASVGPGTQSIDALAALAPHGFAVPNGNCPTVAAGGFLTGGGFGMLTRAAGMGCDRLLGAEVVLANGRRAYASADREPDLFWALRGGGGGNFGVVTRYDVRPIPVRRMVNFVLVFSWDQAPAVIDAFSRWIVGKPDELATALLLRLPNADPKAVPDVAVGGGWLGVPADVERHLDELIALVGKPPANRIVFDLDYQTTMMQRWGCATYSTAECHQIFPGTEGKLPREHYQRTRGRMFDRPMPSDGVAKMLTAFDQDRRAGQNRHLMLFALGGAVNRIGRRDTAYVHRSTQFYVDYAVSITTGPASREDRMAADNWVDRGFAAIDPYSNGEAYQNFIDPLLPNWRRAYYGENYGRLAVVKHRYDPYRFFKFSQAIG
ncbi:FAD-binding oxidoreductase [Kibdelosporangium aridum]|uniref:FAD-binding oxidoreductase n=1 Tax=Kibdelosporangium aridum TaxID=2030 RepID=UPI00068F80C9|nr:FAD-dependent oxidoreductase [Kibdelosporangium aridum]